MEEKMSDQLLQQIDELLARRLGTMEESLVGKMELLAEGQQLLAEKLDATRDELKADIAKVDYRLTVVEARLDQKIDGLAADLKAHRHDTESHGSGYLVSE
jgi:hypothetical protein